MSLSPLSAALNCKYDVSLGPAVCQWPAVEQARCLLPSCFSLIRLRTLNCERCWEPSWGARGLPWAQRACALTHHLTSVNLKIVNLKIRWVFLFVFYN